MGHYNFHYYFNWYCFHTIKNFNSPEAQTKILVNAIDNNDAQKVATLISTKDVPVDDEEASVYIQYIKDEVGMMKFIHDVKHTTDKLNKSNHDSAYIQTKTKLVKMERVFNL